MTIVVKTEREVRCEFIAAFRSCSVIERAFLRAAIGTCGSPYSAGEVIGLDKLEVFRLCRLRRIVRGLSAIQGVAILELETRNSWARRTIARAEASAAVTP